MDFLFHVFSWDICITALLPRTTTLSGLRDAFREIIKHRLRPTAEWFLTNQHSRGSRQLEPRRKKNQPCSNNSKSLLNLRLHPRLMREGVTPRGRPTRRRGGPGMRTEHVGGDESRPGERRGPSRCWQAMHVCGMACAPSLNLSLALGLQL